MSSSKFRVYFHKIDDLILDRLKGIRQSQNDIKSNELQSF